MTSPPVDNAYLSGLKQARALISSVLQKENITPLFIRLAVHDAFAYDSRKNTFGANASIRTQKELSHKGNEGLQQAVTALAQVRAQVPDITAADLYQLAGIEAVRQAGGPAIPFRPGRKDAWTFPPESAYVSPNTSARPLEEFRRWCDTTGLPLRASVALLGVHCIARWWPDGDGGYSLPHQSLDNPEFGNQYFRMLLAGKLPQDAWLLEDLPIRKLITHYAEDEAAFLEEYSSAHEQLTRLGTKLEAASPADEPVPASSGEPAGLPSVSAQLDTTQYWLAAAGVAVVGGLVAYGLWRRRRRRGAWLY